MTTIIQSQVPENHFIQVMAGAWSSGIIPMRVANGYCAAEEGHANNCCNYRHDREQASGALAALFILECFRHLSRERRKYGRFGIETGYQRAYHQTGSKKGDDLALEALREEPEYHVGQALEQAALCNARRQAESTDDEPHGRAGKRRKASPKVQTPNITKAQRPTRVMTKSGHIFSTIHMIRQTKIPAKRIDATVSSPGGVIKEIPSAMSIGIMILISFITVELFFLFISLLLSI